MRGGRKHKNCGTCIELDRRARAYRDRMHDLTISREVADDGYREYLDSVVFRAAYPWNSRLDYAYDACI